MFKIGSIYKRTDMLDNRWYTLRVTNTSVGGWPNCVKGVVVDPGTSGKARDEEVVAPKRRLKPIPVPSDIGQAAVDSVEALRDAAEAAWDAGYAAARAEFDRRYDSIVTERNQARDEAKRELANSNALRSNLGATSDAKHRAEMRAREAEDRLTGSRLQVRRLEDEVARVQSLTMGVPRSVLIQLTPPGVEPSQQPLWWSPSSHTSLMGEADLVIAASVDDSYVKCLKNRYGSEDDMEIKVRWER